MLNRPLLCFTSELYTPYEEIDTTDYPQCIAPTVRGTRCRWQINEGDSARAIELRKTAESLCDGVEREDILRQFVLLNCCVKCHREKLEAHPQCLGELIQQYGNVIPKVEANTDTTHPGANLEPGRTKHFTRNSSSLAAYDAQEHIKDEVFKSYAAALDETETVREALLSPASLKWAKRGHVYSFTRPSNPEFVKIGFTGKTAQERVAQQEVCNPGAKLQTSAFFEYPERIERLVHLQMAKWRHKIIVCRNCKHMHYEWFKVPVSHAGGIINDWAKVVAKEALYSENGQLTAKWRLRIATMEGDITAKRLLKALDDEVKQGHHHREMRVVHSGSKYQAIRNDVDRTLLGNLSTEQQNAILTFFADFMYFLTVSAAQDPTPSASAIEPSTNKVIDIVA